jgi:CheY-like chemotaxis protein
MADTKTIAVVDHDPTFLRILDHLLRTAGYNPVQCPGGAGAHDVISQLQPDLILIDTWLGTRDEGWVVLQTLRLDEATLAIPILLTTSDPEEVKQRSAEVEAMTNMIILPKPFNPDSLLGAVERILMTTWNADENASYYRPPENDPE